MKLIILLILLSLIPLASASAVDLGADMIKDGINSFLQGVGDDLYKAGNIMSNQTNQSNNASFAALLNSMVSYNYEPYTNENIRNTRNMTALIFMVLATLYLFAGATYVQLHVISPSSAQQLDWIGGFDYNAFSMNEYLSTLVTAMLIIFFSYIMVAFVLMLNQAVTSLLSTIIIDFLPPAFENVIMYLTMAIVYLGLAIVMAYRILIIGIFATFPLVLGGLYLFKPMRNVVTRVAIYFVEIVFLQSILVAEAGVGVMVINSLGTIVANFFILYLALGILMILTSLWITLGFATMKRAQNKITYNILR